MFAIVIVALVMIWSIGLIDLAEFNLDVDTMKLLYQEVDEVSVSEETDTEQDKTNFDNNFSENTSASATSCTSDSDDKQNYKGQYQTRQVKEQDLEVSFLHQDEKDHPKSSRKRVNIPADFEDADFLTNELLNTVMREGKDE